MNMNQRRNEGARVAQCPGRRITGGAEKFQNVAITSFNTVHSLLKDLWFEYGGAKSFLVPGAI